MPSQLLRGSAAEATTHLTLAFNGTVPSNAIYSSYTAEFARVGEFALANSFAAAYANETNAALATRVLTNLGVTATTINASSYATLAAAVETAFAAYPTARGQVALNLARLLTGLEADATYGAAAIAWNNSAATAFSYSSNTANTTSTTLTALNTPANQTFTLTTGVDAFTGGEGNDTFNTNVASLGALDVISGGAGTDTLNVVDLATAIANFGSATISGIETVNINTGGAVGTLYAAGTSAGVDTAAVAQRLDFALGTPSATTQNYTVTIAGVAYTTDNVGTASAAAAWGVIKAVIDSKIGNSVSFDDTNYYVTSKNAGVPLPSISIALNSSGTGTASISANVAAASATSTDSIANVVATGAAAVKQVLSMVVAETGAGTTDPTNLAAGDVLRLNIGGTDYVFTSTGSTATTLGSDIAAVINSVLGAGTATASSGTVLITAPTAGTPLPTFHLYSGPTTGAPATDATDWTATITQVVANQAANAAASGGSSAAALSLSGLAGLTAAKVTATGAANVTGTTTTALDVTAAGGSAQTTSGSSVTVVASGSVGVYSAAGPVSITATNPSSTTLNPVISTAGTGASTTGYAAGIYVTGGTTVTASQAGGTVSSTSAVRTAYTNLIKVGVNPTEVASATLVTGSPISGAAKTSSTATFYGTVAGLASMPTGDVTTSAASSYTVPSVSGTLANGSAGKSAVLYGTGTQSVFVNGATTVSMTGVGTGTITDVNTQFVQKSATDATGSAFGASKLATVNLTGISGTTTIKSDAISTVSVVNSTGSGAVIVANSGTEGANAGAFNLTVGNSTVTVTNATATSVNIGSTTTSFATINGTAPALNTNALTLNAGAATSLNFTNANTVNLTNGGLAKVASITASGAGNLALGDVSSGWTALTSVNATSKSGNVSITLGSTPNAATANGFTLTTGSGNDTVTLSGLSTGTVSVTGGGLATTTISLGAGNDTLLKSGSGAVIAGAVIDAGDGTDTVAASLVTAGNGAIFRNFERIAVAGATDGGSLDASLLTNSAITAVLLNGALSATATNTFAVSNIAGTTVNFDVTANTAATIIGTLASASGTSDVAVVNFSSANTGGSSVTITAGGVATSGVEALQVNSGGSITNNTDFTTLTVSNVLTKYTDTGNTLKTVTLTGSNALTLGNISVTTAGVARTITGATFTADFLNQQTATLTSSIVSGAKVASSLTSIDGSAATGNLNIYAGGAKSISDGTNTGSLTFNGLSITGGSGNDALRNDAVSGVTNGGAGNDWIVVGGNLGSANGGTGDDTITADSTNVSLSGGGGKDSFVFTSNALATSTTAPNVTTVTDFIKGDTLKLGTTSSIVDATSAVSSATSLVSALGLALGLNASGVAVWFTYGGNTYVALSDGSAGLSANDMIVKLNGVVDLTSATLAADVITGG